MACQKLLAPCAPPLACPPACPAPVLPHMQARCAELLESSGIHYTIIGLTLLDLAIVVTELILSSIFPAAEAVPHAGGGLERGWQVQCSCCEPCCWALGPRHAAACMGTASRHAGAHHT